MCTGLQVYLAKDRNLKVELELNRLVFHGKKNL